MSPSAKFNRAFNTINTVLNKISTGEATIDHYRRAVDSLWRVWNQMEAGVEKDRAEARIATLSGACERAKARHSELIRGRADQFCVENRASRPRSGSFEHELETKGCGR